MKKRLAIIAAVVLLAVNVISCSDDDGGITLSSGAVSSLNSTSQTGSNSSSLSSVASESSSGGSSSAAESSTSAGSGGSNGSVSAGSSSVSSAGSSSGQSSSSHSNRIVISEIAWAGTDISYLDEWIELYNNTSQPINLNGWTIAGEVTVTLSGTVPAGGYYLLERTDDDTVPGIAADLIYSGSLGNTGGVLAVVDNSGSTNDLVEMSAGWASGSNSPKLSMERIALSGSGSDPANWRNGSGDIEGAQNSGTVTGSSSSASSVAGTIKIGSFNVQILGSTKLGRPNTLNVLAMIATNFDILAIQEVGSNSVPDDENATTAMESYTAKINEHAGTGSYAYVRGHQYAYVYRTAKVVCHASQLYSDTNAFAYTPLLAEFSTVQGNFTFSMINVHTSPSVADSEIPLLLQVIADVKTLYGNDDVICAGDYNADGSYYDDGGDAQGWLTGFDPATYITAIPNSADTTVSVNNNFTYDRMQLTMTLTEDYTGNWGVFPMGQVYDVTVCEGTDTRAGTEAALSDHYPVWSEYYIGRDTD